MITKEEVLENLEQVKEWIEEEKKITKIDISFAWYKKEWKDVDLSSLRSIAYTAYLEGYSGNLSSLESIGYTAHLEGCSLELKKSLAKTLKSCGKIYIEYRDEPLTLEEFKKLYK